MNKQERKAMQQVLAVTDRSVNAMELEPEEALMLLETRNQFVRAMDNLCSHCGEFERMEGEEVCFFCC